MSLVVNVLTFIASGILWLFKKFLPFLSKKFGIGALKFAARKASAFLLVSVTVAFYAAFIVFIAETYNVLSAFINSLNSGAVSFPGTSGSQYIGCAYYLLNASGISAGLSSAFTFGLAVFAFLFLHSLYTSTIQVLKILDHQVSELFKTLY